MVSERLQLRDRKTLWLSDLCTTRDLTVKGAAGSYQKAVLNLDRSIPDTELKKRRKQSKMKVLFINILNIFEFNINFGHW